LDPDDVEIEVAHALGRAEERERIKAIISSEAAIGRGGPTLTLALDTDLPARQAIELLQRMPAANASGIGGWRRFLGWGPRQS
jgi:hypothetical protein